MVNHALYGWDKILPVKRACVLHVMLDEFRGEVRYKPKIFVENETEGRGYFQRPWNSLRSLLERWGLSKTEIAALKKRVDKNQHATQAVQVEESRLGELYFKPDDMVDDH